MSTQIEDQLEPLLRTLRLAQAQLRILKKQCGADSVKFAELEDVEIALNLIFKKLALLENLTVAPVHRP